MIVNDNCILVEMVLIEVSGVFYEADFTVS